MFTVGLTGGIGSGKSTVAAMLERKGAHVIDADAFARDALNPGRREFTEVVQRFGPGILDPIGEINRSALSAIVFADEIARRDLESIVHPGVGSAMLGRLEEIRENDSRIEGGGNSIVVLDVPLLVESGVGFADFVLVVEAPLDIRLWRLEARGVARSDALNRIKAQATDDERRKRADAIIENGGTVAELEEKLAAVWAVIRSLSYA